MNFKNTPIFNIAKILGILYSPIVIFIILGLCGFIRLWGTGSSGLMFIFSIIALIGTIVSPFLLIVLGVFFWHEYMKYGYFDYSTMDALDWLLCGLTVIFPLLGLSVMFSSAAAHL